MVVERWKFCNRNDCLEVEKGKDGTGQKIGNWGGTVFYEWGGCLGRRYVPAGSDNKIPRRVREEDW